jgi:hypothetical protein
VSALTQRICSGTSVPGARTCRTMVPRRTVSIHSVARSTLGAAGSRRVSATLTPTMATRPRPAPMYLPFLDFGARAMSNGILGSTGGRVENDEP